MPAVDLSKVNISLQQFQDISSGKYNAGEVKLASATTLDKMNHHVRQKFRNDEIISHQEVIAIKEALVKALSQHGVGAEEIGKIRRELGLAPDGAADRQLHARSIKPLSRQQIRQILDRNALSNDPQIHMESNLALDTLRMQSFFVAPRNAAAGH